MKTRRTRSSGGTDDGEEGDPSLIAFRRLRTGTDLPTTASSNASAASGGDSKKKSPSSQPTSRRSPRLSGGDDDDNEDSNVKSTASTGAPAPRRSTRSSNSVGDAEESPSAAGNSAKGRTSKTQPSSLNNQGKSSVASKSKEPATEDEKDLSQQENLFENGKEDTILQEEDDNRKPAARTKKQNTNDEREKDDDESQHHTPPVKEITTTTTRHHHHHHRSSGVKKKKQRGEGPKYLEDNTLKLVHDYVEEYKGDPLDEDDVIGFMTRVQKTANEQAKYQMQFVTGRAARHPDSDRESDYNSDDTSVFQDCLGEEEEHAVGHDMFKKVVANIQLEHSRKGGTTINASTRNGGSLTNANKLLDKKTLMWIKRAAGLHRTDPGKMLMQKTADGKGGRMSTRRYTRKQALDRRGQKKKERGLDILGTAVNELEPEHGPFPERKIKRKKKKIRRLLEEDEVVDRKRKKDKGTSADESKRKKKKRSAHDDEEPVSSKEKLARKDREKSKSRKKKRRHEARREKRKRRKLEKSVQELPEDNAPIVTSLSQLDWLWRSRQNKYRDFEKPLETEADFQARKAIHLHPQFVQAGIVHQLPRMHSLAREHEFPDDTPGRVYDPPRQRHTDQQYAQFCSRLMSCLQGPARLFATCEFFYSDIDRGWYNLNPFASAASELGVPKREKLTRREWSAVRRRMTNKPRRFSEKFIVSQLSDRNEYRSTYRKLQNNPHLAATEKFPFDVHAQIRPGTMVTAYSKRFRIIQRGRVLTFDRKTALYLIEFENGQFGFELCPDSDVATCGVPVVLISGKKREPDEILLGSSTGPQPGNGIIPEENINVNDCLGKALGFSPVGSPERVAQGDKKSAENGSKPVTPPSSLLETVAEYDSFLTLMETVDAARKRKQELLGLIDDANALMVNNLPFGDGGNVIALSSEAKAHLAWLRSNLEQTNRVLMTATDYLRVLFGEAYHTRPCEPEKGRDLSSNLLRAAVAAQSAQTSQPSRAWAARLIGNCDDVTGSLAWANTADTGSRKQKNQPRDVVHIDNLWIDIRHRIAAAGQCVCTASYIRDAAANGGPAGPDCGGALDVGHQKLIHTFEFPESTGETDHHLYNEVLEARESAKKDLRDALNLLKTELALSNLTQTAPRAAVGTD